MKLKELQSLVAGGENERVEFKATTGQRTQAGKTVCGLLNNLGGFVVFGVTDKGGIVARRSPPERLKELRRNSEKSSRPLSRIL